MSRKKGRSDDVVEMINRFSIGNIERIECGIKPIDMFFGGDISKPGFIKGKFYSISGPNGVGKSTFVMELVRRFVEQGKFVVYCDIENGLNENILKSMGLMDYVILSVDKIDRLREGGLLIINPRTFSNIAKLFKGLIDRGVRVDVGVIDSLKAILPSALDENVDLIESGGGIGLNARSQENFLPFMKNLFSGNNILGIFINQMRMKITSFGGFLSEPQSNAFLYNMDVRCIMREVKDGSIKVKVRNIRNEVIEKKVGNWVDISIVKGRLGNSFSVLSIPLIFGKGVSLIYLYREILSNKGFIKIAGVRSGSLLDIGVLLDALGSYGEVDMSVVRDSGVVKYPDGLNEFIRSNVGVIEEMIIGLGLMNIEEEV